MVGRDGTSHALCGGAQSGPLVRGLQAVPATGVGAAGGERVPRIRREALGRRRHRAFHGAGARDAQELRRDRQPTRAARALPVLPRDQLHALGEPRARRLLADLHRLHHDRAAVLHRVPRAALS